MRVSVITEKSSVPLARLTDELIAGMTRGQPTELSMMDGPVGGFGLGLGVQRTGQTVWFQHAGTNPGYRALIVGIPSKGEGAVMLSNGAGGEALHRRILRRLSIDRGWAIHSQ